MEIEIKLDNSYLEPKIVIFTASMNDDVTNIINTLSNHNPQIISGSKNNRIEVIQQDDLIRIYANSGKIFALTHKGEYKLRLRLYEIEKYLPKNQFIRISNSEIINLKKVDSFDFSFTGTIAIKLIDGTTTYVSRRYVSKLKKLLGI